MKSMLPLLLVLALFAGAMAQGSKSRESVYLSGKDGKPTADQFQAAKVGLLDAYAKAKNVKWTKEKEEKKDGYYSITYAFATPEILADFQKWQYEQASFKATLDAFSQKAKGTGASAPKTATGRKLAL